MTARLRGTHSGKIELQNYIEKHLQEYGAHEMRPFFVLRASGSEVVSKGGNI